MPVEKDIDLNKPLSDADIRQMEAEADRLEELSKKAHENSEKTSDLQNKEDQLLNDAIKKVEQIEKEAEKAEKARTRTGRTAFGTGQENAPMGHILRLQAELEESQKKQKEVEKQIRDQLAEQKAMLHKVQNDFSQVLQVNADPVGFGVGKLKGLVAKGGIYGLIALAVIEMADQIFEQVKAMYAPGGPYDVRKQMEDRDREMVEMEHLLDRKSGRVFFTSDVELQSGPPDFSNTVRLGHRVIQFQNKNVGGA